MPIFEYQCRDCGRKFEELVSSADEPIACPSCHSANTLKLLSVFAASVPSGGTAMNTACGRAGCGSGFS